MTVVGNRPQFIKMAPISHEINKRGYSEFIIHTGQHFDENMSDVFFKELRIPKPDINLNIHTSNHGSMTGEMLIKLEDLMIQHKPQSLLIYGDTNSTLAAALAAVKLHIPIAHVEAGPRIYDIDTPEEINRIVADRSARLKFCPDIISVQNLAKENITDGVYFTGDVMYDAYLEFSRIASVESKVLNEYKITGDYVLLTVHRPNNTCNEEVLNKIIDTISLADSKFVFVVHPRTENAFKKYGLWEKLNACANLILIKAVGYLDMMQLVNNCRLVLTDSGGLQKEAFFAGKPTVILFYATPWPQIMDAGWQKLCWDNGIDVQKALTLIRQFNPKTNRPELFGDGQAAIKIVDILEKNNWFGEN